MAGQRSVALGLLDQLGLQRSAGTGGDHRVVRRVMECTRQDVLRSIQGKDLQSSQAALQSQEGFVVFNGLLHQSSRDQG